MAIPLEFWHWWIAAAIFLILEVFLPGAIFLWMGCSAIIVGVLLFFVPELDWKSCGVIFALLSVISFRVWRRVYQHTPVSNDQPFLNQRGRQFIGRHFTLTEPVINGVGYLRADDSHWKIHGPDCPVGTTIVITAVDGIILNFRINALPEVA